MLQSLLVQSRLIRPEEVLKAQTPLLFMSLVTLMPVLLSAYRAKVLPSTNPTPEALSVLPEVRSTRLETLVVGTMCLVVAMPQPLTTMIRRQGVMLGLPVTYRDSARTKRTTLRVTAQVGVVPLLKTTAMGRLGPPLPPTLRHP